MGFCDPCPSLSLFYRRGHRRPALKVMEIEALSVLSPQLCICGPCPPLAPQGSPHLFQAASGSAGQKQLGPQDTQRGWSSPHPHRGMCPTPTTRHHGHPPPTPSHCNFQIKDSRQAGAYFHPVSGAYFLLQVITSSTFLATQGLRGGAAFPDSPGCSDTRFSLFLFHMPRSSLWSGCSLSTLNKHFLWFTHNNSLDLGSQAVELCICIGLIFTQQAA